MEADTKIVVEPFDTVDLSSDHPLLFEEGTKGTLGIKDEGGTDYETQKTLPEESSTGGGSGSSKGGAWLGFLSVEYYQPYFDVTTTDVFYRVMAGMFPFPFKLSTTLSSSPDLYGPFWLCMTLIFTTAISGNLSSLMSGTSQWEFHFHEVIVIATVIYTYTWSLPILLWLFLVWRNATERYSLIKMQSIYGYSMAIYIPLTLLWIINVEVIRWLVLLVAIGLSGLVLVQALWVPLQNETKRVAVVLLAVVFLLHSGVAVGFKFYYFSSSLAPDKQHQSPTEFPSKVSHPASVIPSLESISSRPINGNDAPDVNKGPHDSKRPNGNRRPDDDSVVPPEAVVGSDSRQPSRNSPEGQDTRNGNDPQTTRNDNRPDEQPSVQLTRNEDTGKDQEKVSRGSNAVPDGVLSRNGDEKFTRGAANIPESINQERPSRNSQVPDDGGGSRTRVNQKHADVLSSDVIKEDIRSDQH